MPAACPGTTIKQYSRSSAVSDLTTTACYSNFILLLVLLCLHYFSLVRNKIENDGCEAIVQALMLNSTLIELE